MISAPIVVSNTAYNCAESAKKTKNAKSNLVPFSTKLPKFKKASTKSCPNLTMALSEAKMSTTYAAPLIESGIERQHPYISLASALRIGPRTTEATDPVTLTHVHLRLPHDHNPLVRRPQQAVDPTRPIRQIRIVEIPPIHITHAQIQRGKPTKLLLRR